MIIVVLFNPSRSVILIFSALWEDAVALRRKLMRKLERRNMGKK